MKKLKFTEGSLSPFWTKDLEYLQDSFEEVVKGIVRGLSLEDKNIIISGCKITDTGGRISMTPGWCYYEGEILRVEELSPTYHSYNNPTVLLNRSILTDGKGKRQIIQNGDVFESYVYEEARLLPRLIEKGDYVLSGVELAIAKGAWDLGERLMYSSKMQDSGLQRVAVSGYNGEVCYRQIGGAVQLHVDIRSDYTQGGPDGVVANGLPRPSKEIVIGDLRISTIGELIVSNLPYSVKMDNIMYLSTPTYPTDDGHYSYKQNTDIS